MTKSTTTTDLRRILKSRKVKESYTILRVLSGITRFKIVLILNYRERGLTVSEIASVLDMSLPSVSHQLKILRKHKVVTGRGMNREVVYALNNHHLRKILSFS
ncbi:MAG TPA: metalloregulator ArsR/SmtB family transcription factor [Patescibacteria group bacterium]